MKKYFLTLLLLVSVASTTKCVDGDEAPRGIIKRSKELVVNTGGLVVKYKVESAALVAVLVAAHYSLKKYSPWYEENIAPYVALRALRAKFARKKNED